VGQEKEGEGPTQAAALLRDRGGRRGAGDAGASG
jgi:hypothetical protein